MRLFPSGNSFSITGGIFWMPDNYLGHDEVGHRCCHSRMFLAGIQTSILRNKSSSLLTLRTDIFGELTVI
ncbi:MAG: hypothetical protein GY702_26710 [Desulfobulbaceae bacterium]|nr:hypothetical protein [Desulfobulbaceae bacterium]